jgi:CheY-like chemotaxis protein
MALLEKPIETSLDDLNFCFIDNEQKDRIEIEDSLKELRFTKSCIVVDYSAEIVARAIANEFDVLITDYKMPEKDGITILEEIRQRNGQIILGTYTGWAIPSESEEDLRCRRSCIQQFMKYDGIGCLLGTLQNQLPQIRQQLKTMFGDNTTRRKKLFSYFSNVIGTTTSVNVIHEPSWRQKMIEEKLKTAEERLEKLEEARGAIIELANELLNDLKQSEDQDAYIMSPNGRKITISEITSEIENLTPLGIEHLKYWFLAKSRLIRKK